MEPVSDVDIGTSTAEVAYQRRMTVTEDTIVKMFFLKSLLAVDDDTLAVVAEVVEHVFLAMPALVAIAPAVGNTEGKSRRKHLEKLVAKTAAEEDAHKVEPPVGMSKTVTMADEETLAVEFHLHRVIMNDGAKLFGQVVEYPHVVIADEEMNLHATIGQFGQLAQQTHMATGHQIFVSEPKIKNIMLVLLPS